MYRASRDLSAIAELLVLYTMVVAVTAQSVTVPIGTGPFKTGLWVLLTAAMMAGFIYSMIGITSKFFSYPSSVGIVIQHANDLQFPAITICNKSPIRASRYNEIVLGISSNRRKRSTPEGRPTYH